MAYIAVAGPISERFASDPDQIVRTIKTVTYAELVALIRDAYAESKAVGGENAEYICMLALDQVPDDKKIALALDFSLAQPDTDLKMLGARAISMAILNHVQIDAGQRQQAIFKLWEQVSQSAGNGRDAFRFVGQAAKALILLGDDTGLDIWLTDAQTVSNYSKKDGWDPTSEAALFQDLKVQYDQLAAAPGAANPVVNKQMAATYELCRLRRTQNKEIKSISPLANLDRLVKR